MAQTVNFFYFLLLHSIKSIESVHHKSLAWLRTLKLCVKQKHHTMNTAHDHTSTLTSGAIISNNFWKAWPREDFSKRVKELIFLIKSKQTYSSKHENVIKNTRLSG